MRRIGVSEAIHGITAISIVVHHVLLPQLKWLWHSVNMFFVLPDYLVKTIQLGNEMNGFSLFSFDAHCASPIMPLQHVARWRRTSIIDLVPGRPGRG